MAQQQYFLGRVTQVDQEQRLTIDDQTFYLQELRISKKDGEVVNANHGSQFQPLSEQERLEVGDRVIMVEQTTSASAQSEYAIADTYRMPIVGWLLAGFLALVFLVSSFRGLLSMLGMVISLAVLIWFIIPQILAGADPVTVSLIGSAMIGAVTIYLSHGWSLKSHLSLGSIMITLLGVTWLAEVSVRLAGLAGLGSEEAFFLQVGPTAEINLQGLLLGGIILGALGVLDDIVVSQVSVVSQLRRANQSLSFEELYHRALEVGKDHVASLVNTLVLAYTGANLPLFLLFYLNQDMPSWVGINNQLIAEEIVRTLVGSIGLVLAVPLTTIVTAYVLNRNHRVDS